MYIYIYMYIYRMKKDGSFHDYYHYYSFITIIYICL